MPLPVMGVVKEIWDLEGFCIRFKDNELKAVEPDYSKWRENRCANTRTIAEWENTRFREIYGTHEIDVLDGYGNKVHKGKLLKNLRATYKWDEGVNEDEEDEDEDWD